MATHDHLYRDGPEGNSGESPPAHYPNDPESWSIQSTQRPFANNWLAVELDQVTLPSGATYQYTRLVPTAPGVAVIGFNQAGEILLEREYRHGVGRAIWQLPGGLAAEDEDRLHAGLRELREETGYVPADARAVEARYLGSVWDNPAFGPACSHVYAVWKLVQAATPTPDTAESVTLHRVTPAWLRQAVAAGEIKDRVVISAVAWLLLDNLL